MAQQNVRFRCLRLAGPAVDLEAALATAWDSGASGVEERDPDPSAASGVSGSELIVYAPAEAIARLESSLRSWAARRAPALRIGPVEEVVEEDWTERFRVFQHAVDVSPRLRIRPPWVAGSARDVVIEARQAFGTGAHASTALALQGLDESLLRNAAGRVLDLGCGSGVLAIAALRCGAGRVYACDTDPQAARETAENARLNRVERGLVVWCGSLEACRLVDIDLAIANMVRRELLPLLPGLVGCLAEAGELWLSGLLDADLPVLEEELGALQFRIEERLGRDEAGDQWIAIQALREPRPRIADGGALDRTRGAGDRRAMIVGVAGPYAAGKGEVVRFLAERGYEAYSLSDVIRDALSARGLDETRERMIETGRALREADGPAVLAERLAARFRADQHYVIDSIRHPAEVEELRARAGRFVLLWVDAPPALRFERLRERGRPGDPRDPRELAAFEERERGEGAAAVSSAGQQLGAVAALADFRVPNDGDLHALHSVLEKLLVSFAD